MGSPHELRKDAQETDVTPRLERGADVATPPAERERTPLAQAELMRDLAREGQARYAFLAQASRWLAQSLDYEATLATIAGLALPQFGAWCIVDLCEPDGTVRRLAIVHPDRDKQALVQELHRRYPPSPDDAVGVPRVMRTGESEVVLDVPDAALAESARDPDHLALLRALGMRSYMIVPMMARGRILGAITFVTGDGERRYGAADLLLAEDLAARCAMAVDNARLYRDAQAARVEAEAANRAKSAFLTMMSHDLRAPLGTISAYVELLATGCHGPVTEAQRADLAAIERSQRHLLGLINEVLTFAQVEAGRVEYALADVPANAILAEAEALVAPLIASTGLACQLTRCDPTLLVRADREKLRQILVNLLSNAIKFTERGGTITVTCEPADGAVAVRVSDTGLGVPAEQIEVIFDPFVQLDAGRATVMAGTGLGLAISRELARGMGGDLTVESTLGIGSTFTLRLPRAE